MEIQKLCLNTEELQQSKQVQLTEEQINVIVQILNYDIDSNKEIIDYKKTKYSEAKAWIEENKFLNQIISKLQEEKQVVIQKVEKELTTEQEDYIIESGLERIREEREK